MGGELWEKFPELCGTPFEKNYRRVMAQQEPMEFEASDPAEKKWFEVHCYPSGGGVSAFFRDVTERKRSEDERLTTGKLESVGTLAGGIAHDLNNILTVISGNIGLAQLEAPGDAKDLLTYLSKAAQAAQHAAHLSSQLLTFSKGGAPVKRVIDITRNLTKAIEFALHGSNVRAEIDIPPEPLAGRSGLGPNRAGDERADVNAREAMLGGGTVEITARNVPPRKQNRCVAARRTLFENLGGRSGWRCPREHRDDGFSIRISQQNRPAVDSVFPSAFLSSRNTAGCCIWNSSSSTGAVFTFYLPAAKLEVIPLETDGTSAGLHLNNQRVLVMDDEAGIRDLTSQLRLTRI